MIDNTEWDMLYEIAKEYTEEELGQAVTKYKSPEVFYHFSSLRTNLVSWYDGIRGADLLEVGGECGALTSYFSRQASTVHCLEVLSERQRINRERNRNQKNITYLDGGLEALGEDTYDVIFVGDAFCRAGTYTAKRQLDGVAGQMDGTSVHRDVPPQLLMLQTLLVRLRVGGTLMLAVENRMGMRYFMGALEEYSGEYFGGIDGKAGADGARSFTSKEMEQLLAQFPKASTRVYYPYPDYRYPRVIYSPEFLPNKGELNLNGNDVANSRLHLYDETKAMDLIVEHGLFPYFSNSYLYLLEKTAE